MPSRLPIAVAMLIALAATVRGDEAIRRDGTRLTGQLTFSKEGGFSFSADGGAAPFETLEAVRFAAKAPPARPVRLWHQVHFGHGEVVQAEFRKLDATYLDLRAAWEGPLYMPRAAIERVTHEAGWQPVLFDAFDDGLAQWQKAGEPHAKFGQLRFNRDGQAIANAFKTPLEAGRVDVRWRSEITKTRRVTLVLDFASDVVRVELVSPGDQFAVATALKPDHVGKLKREGGMNDYSLSAEFSRDRLVICIGELVLWARDTGVKGLRAIRLESTGAGEESPAVTSVQVARPEADVASKPWADLTADAVRSPAGDETFGSLVSAGPAGIVLGVKEQKLTFSWHEVGEFAFRRDKTVEAKTVGEHVRVRVRSANGARDVFEGAVTLFDERRLMLAHRLLGPVSIPRENVEEIRFDFHGQRIPVDSTPRHLGSRPAFGFAVVKPEGLRFAKSIDVLIQPKESFVVVDAAQVDKNGAPAEVLVNGEVVGTLNRLADRADATVRSYRLPVPLTRWRSRDNEIEVRVRPPDGAKVNGIDLRAVRLELTRQR